MASAGFSFGSLPASAMRSRMVPGRAVDRLCPATGQMPLFYNRLGASWGGGVAESGIDETFARVSNGATGSGSARF